MKRLLTALVLPLALIACGGDDKKADAADATGDGGQNAEAAPTVEEQLLGTWGITQAAVDEMITEMFGELAADAAPQDIAMRDEMASSMKQLKVTFEAGGAMSMVDPQGPKSGTYEITSSDGNTLNLSTFIDGDQDDVVATIDGDNLSVAFGEDVMKFARE